MQSRKGLSWYLFNAVEVAENNKESIITASVLLYAGFYLLIGIGGISFQIQPALGYITNPNPPSNPDPANESFMESSVNTVPISAIYSDDDGHKGTLTFYDLGTGSSLGSCNPSDGDRCGIDWSVSNGENWWYAVANDDGDDASTTSNNWMFYINKLPNVYNPNPADGGIVTTENPEISIQANDDRSDTLTAYFFSHTGDPLGKEEFASGGEASTTYSDTYIGGDYTWKVNVSDGDENITETYSFERTTTENTRVDQRIDYRYSSVILSPSDTRDIFFEIENRAGGSKSMRTYLSGVNATFPEYSRDSTDVYTLEDEPERFMVRISPESSADTKTYLNITSEDQDLGINTTASIPVTVKNYTDVSQTAEVSGIGTLQLIMLLLVSSYLYSVRL